MKQSIEEHRNRNDEEIAKKKAEIASSIDQNFRLQKDIELIQKHIDVLQKKIQDKVFVEKKSKKLLQLESKIETNKG